MLFPPVIGGYTLRAKVGEGPFGAVFRAWDDNAKRERCLKVMHPPLAQDATWVDRWHARVQASMALDHPDLVVPEAVARDAPFAFVVLPCWPRDLRQELVLHGPWSPPRAVALVRRLAAALRLAHKDGLVHADLRPSNVLLAAPDRVGLTDLGWMSAAVATYGPRLGEVIPRLAADPYVPPEIESYAALTPAADVYGLAQLLHELLTGRTFPIQAWEARRADLDALGALAPALHAGLQPDPSQRPADLDGWLALLPPVDGTARTAAAAPTRPAETAPEFAPLPTPEEASAQAQARAEAWDQVVVPTAPRDDKRELWLGCAVLGLVALFVMCGLAGLGTWAWWMWSTREEARATAPPPLVTVPGAPQNPDLLTWRTLAQQLPPDWSDDFADPTSGWPDDNRDEMGLLDYDQDEYVIEAYSADVIVAALYPFIYTGPVVLQVDVRLPSYDPQGDGAFGLLCAMADDENYYTMDISEDGYVSLWRMAPDTLAAIAIWEPLPPQIYDALREGQWVQLTGVCDAGHLALWANDVLLVEGQDPLPTPLTSGQVGLFVNTLSEPDLRVHFDNFALWEMEP